MRNTFLWVLCGLIVFVAVYAFVIPDSNMPVRIKTETIWETEDAVSEILFESENFKISRNSVFAKNSDGWKNIGYPNKDFSDQLPPGLNWPAPEIHSAAEHNRVLYLKFSGDKIISYSKKWSHFSGDKAIDFLPLKSTQNEFDGKIIEINGEFAFKFGQIERSFKLFDETIDLRKKPFENYEITDDGKIKNLETKTISSREDFDPFLVPSRLIETKDSVFALMKSTSNHIPEKWIYVFSKELKLEKKIISGSIAPIEIGLWDDETILILWENGTLSGHTLWGQKKYQFKITDDIAFDMHIFGNRVFVLSNRECLAITLSSKNPELVVWPRILNLGNISKPNTYTVFVESNGFPQASVKGNGARIKSIEEEKDGFLVKIEVNPSGLPAFGQISGELLIEVDGSHEVVPYMFFATGNIKKYKIFSDKLLDLETGDFISYTLKNEKLSFNSGIENSQIYTDFLSGYVFLLSPSPQNDLD